MPPLRLLLLDLIRAGLAAGLDPDEVASLIDEALEQPAEPSSVVTLYQAHLADGTSLGELSPDRQAAQLSGQVELDHLLADGELAPGGLHISWLMVSPAKPGALVAALGLTPDEESLTYAAVLLQQQEGGR